MKPETIQTVREVAFDVLAFVGASLLVVGAFDIERGLGLMALGAYAAGLGVWSVYKWA